MPFSQSKMYSALIMFFGTFLCSSAAVSGEGEAIAKKFKTLTHGTRYTLKDSVPLKFNTYHPQGMAVIGDRIYLTSVQVINRGKGEGLGHLFEVDLEGNLLRHLKWDDGPRYHPSGLDFDGQHLWIALAEYKASSTSTVYRVDPETMTEERMFRFDDHLGGLVHNPELKTLLGVNWGSRTFYRWTMNDDGVAIEPDKPIVRNNPNHFVDFQDMQLLSGTPYILMGGVKGFVKPGKNGVSLSMGGIDLYDLKEDAPVNQVPIQLWSKRGRSMNQNPFYVLNTENGLQFFFIPDDNRSTLYIYDVDISIAPSP